MVVSCIVLWTRIVWSKRLFKGWHIYTDTWGDYVEC